MKTVSANPVGHEKFYKLNAEQYIIAVTKRRMSAARKLRAQFWHEFKKTHPAIKETV
jgi:hypothetical protein